MTGYSLRTDRDRFVLWLDQEDAAKVHGRELYDHAVDPQENTNLANEPAHQELVAQLEKQLRDGL
jgi:iduronate 2-sulfatase